MLIVDANVLVAASIGRSKSLVRETVARGVELLATEAAMMETRRVLVRLGRSEAFIATEIEDLRSLVPPLAEDIYELYQADARARLHPRAQPDWPTLAAAMALTADIWSNDRDLFGTGVAVWSTRNVGHTTAE